MKLKAERFPVYFFLLSIALMIFGYFLWDDLFGTDPEDGGVIVVEESLDDAAVPAGGEVKRSFTVPAGELSPPLTGQNPPPITGQYGLAKPPVYRRILD